MSKEIDLARRENGLTVRFLAQSLVNDLVFPDQKGIRCLLQKARHKGIDGTVTFLSLLPKTTIEYFFFFHLEDFGSHDKSEIDLLLRQGETLVQLEVKAFTNPNDSDVKREIVRNHIMLEQLSGNAGLFSRTETVKSILLYSESENLHDNPSATKFDYFSEMFLKRKGPRQVQPMTTWQSKAIAVEPLGRFSIQERDKKIDSISKDLYLLTWNDVLNSLVECNEGNRFQGVISELRGKKDMFRKDVALL